MLGEGLGFVLEWCDVYFPKALKWEVPSLRCWAAGGGSAFSLLVATMWVKGELFFVNPTPSFSD